MAKYKVGDRVRIVNHRTVNMNDDGGMDKWLGKTMTIKGEHGYGYKMLEDENEYCGCGWFWDDGMIAGLAEAQPEQQGSNNLRVVIRFHGNETTAELLLGGAIVKTATARCNPKDEYSRSEGVRIAVERLFEKKTGKAKEVSKPKVGDKFVVTGISSPIHYFKVGEIVTFAHPGKNGANMYRNEFGLDQVVNVLDVKPYKGESK